MSRYFNQNVTPVSPETSRKEATKITRSEKSKRRKPKPTTRHHGNSSIISQTASTAPEVDADDVPPTAPEIGKRPFFKNKLPAEKDLQTIFVGNLPLSADSKKNDFKKKKDDDGENTESKHFRNSTSAYVVFKSKESVEKGLVKNGERMGALTIRVDAVGKKTFNITESIFVGNLPFDVNEESLRKHFADSGEIVNVRIIRDSNSGIGKGFGYVQFEDGSCVLNAMKLNGVTLLNRKLRIERCTNKPSKSQIVKFAPKKAKLTKKKKPVKTESKSTASQEKRRFRKPSNVSSGLIAGQIKRKKIQDRNKAKKRKTQRMQKQSKESL